MKPQGRTGMLNTNQGTTFAHPQHHPFLRWRGRSGSMEGGWSEIDLPGFRFHPTEEELLDFYLKGAVQGNKLSSSVIEFHNIYRHDPRELPGLARTGEREWYFFVPRDKLSSNGGKPKRTTERGFWKATGSDRPIRSVSDPNQLIGLKKTLVFYEGRAPRGLKTDWIMNEYRLPDTISSPQLPKGDIVLCKIYRKAKSMKELEKRVAPEGKSRPALCVTSGVETYSASATSSSGRDISVQAPPVFPLLEPEVSTKETTVEMEAEAEVSSVPRILDVAKRAMKFPTDLGMLQVPPRSDFDWMADPNLMRTPWLDHISPCYANIFNF